MDFALSAGKTCPVEKGNSYWVHFMLWQAQNKAHPVILVFEGGPWLFVLNSRQGLTVFLPDSGIWFQTAGHARTSLLSCTHLIGLDTIQQPGEDVRQGDGEEEQQKILFMLAACALMMVSKILPFAVNYGARFQKILKASKTRSGWDIFQS